MRRLFLYAGGAVLAIALFLAAAATWLVRRNLPDDATPKIPGLSGAVRATFDDRGVATVAAGSWHDALRVQGYLTARDRLFQLELQRRSAEGTLAELFGRAALDLDRKHRTFGFVHVAARAVSLLPSEESGHLGALADGINAFIESHAGRWGLEFAILRTRPRPFTPADALLVLLLMYEDLTTVWPDEVARVANDRLPEEVRRFVFSNVSEDDVPLVPDREALRPPPLPAVPAEQNPAPFETREASLLADGAAGSNNWAVAGFLTASGMPMLAGDPHLPLRMPSIWLPMRFEVAGTRVEGVTLPGLPGVVIGKNDSIAWSFTNLYTDVQDLYRETIEAGRAVRGRGSEPVVVRVEMIPVRGASAERHEVRETSHGPLVTGRFALKWTALDPSKLRLPIVAIDTAKGPEAFDRALDGFLGPAQNAVWASADGHIGWRATGLLPLRRAETDGSVPYDGTDPKNDWKGFLSPRKLPRLVDPPSGWLVTANNRVVGTGFPVPVSSHFWSAARARRIRDLIEESKRSGKKLDRAAMEAIQLDVVSREMRELARAFFPFLPPDLAKLVAAWDGRADTGSVPYLLARTLRRKLAERTLRLWRVQGGNVRLSDERLLDIATADRAAFRRAGLGDKGAAMRLVAEESVRELSSRFGSNRSRWTWGEANRLSAPHPLGLVPGLSFVFDPPRVPMPGGSGVPRVATSSFGQSMRFVVDWGAPDAATLVVPFGVSGHVGAPHRLDQFRYWLAGDPSGAATRLARPAVERTLTFAP